MNLQDNPYYQLALQYIQQTNLSQLPSGKHVIDGENLWVNITDSPLRTAAEARFEVHNRYVDIQIPLSGAEQYGIRPRSLCTRPIGDFNAQDDLVFAGPLAQGVRLGVCSIPEIKMQGLAAIVKKAMDRVEGKTDLLVAGK